MNLIRHLRTSHRESYGEYEKLATAKKATVTNNATLTQPSITDILKKTLWRVGRGREPWERSEAGGVIGNERHLHHSPVSSPTEELRKG